MAALLGRASRQALFKVPNNVCCQKANLSFSNLPKGKKIAVGVLGTLAAGAVGLGAALQYSVSASGVVVLHPPHLHWNHKKYNGTYDHRSMRRGYQVYKQVCAACHSLKYVAYRDFVGTIMSEEEAKLEAAGVMVEDGPNDQGNMFERPGRLSDYVPSPYKNDNAAKVANNGAVPPDLSLMTLARERQEDYVFHLLTGYVDPPAGIEVKEGLYYNPYFPGGEINMAQALYNEIIEYDDGTPATQSQLAKDISIFLKWCAEPEREVSNLMGIKCVIALSTMTALCYYFKRVRFSSLKSSMVFRKKPGKGTKL